ncbi:MAG: S46 family peptidase [Bacteroidales bacterium]|nr:S46 family peptidase [Bacteroidales bacterium]
MKKLGFLLVCAILLGSAPLKADEGMWLLPLLEKLNIKKMQEMGCKLSAEDIYSINNSSLKDAIVHFGGGCTAEIVSDKGLLFTNHHCGYGNIQALSTVEHDYLKDGYWAMSLKEELPAKGLSVTFIDKFVDVTERLNKAVAKAKNDEDYKKRWNKEVEKIKEEAVKADPTLQARVTSFYNDNMYLLITTRTFKDIRFVGAPPSSIGKFGADTDNWMWPRHTGDFSVFRIYADKNNNPAEYSEENVPYTPKQSLKISLKGVKENDFAMIIGFPGRTTRFMSSEEALETQKINNAISIYVRGEKQDIWMNDMLADPKVRIQYSSKYAGSSNGWKKWMGMNETFDKLNIVERRAAEEKAFNEWVAADPKRVEKYGTAVETINNTIKERAEYAYVYRYLSETLSAIELIKAPQRAQRGGTRQAFYKDYSASTDRKLAKRMIAIYKEKVDAKYHPAFFAEIDSKFGGSIDAFVDNLFDTSVYTSEEKYNEAAKAAVAAGKDLSSDPVEALRKDLHKVSGMIMPKLLESSAKINAAKKAYVAGTLEMMGDNASYPDANSTMRLTYSKVLPYSPKDAVIYDYITTLDGVMEKEDPNNWEFVVPAKLKELWKAKDFGEYALENGKMPVAFLCNGDITGGNSGSPVLNDKGELLGLAFDGNWEAMSGDVIFEPSLQRCINVDIRYVLFIIDKFGGAGYLLNEMNIVR